MSTENGSLAGCGLFGRNTIVPGASPNNSPRIGNPNPVNAIYGGAPYAPLPSKWSRFVSRRRLSWQDMSKLYRRSCDATGKSIITNISEDKAFPVYDQPYWWSDEWDFRQYGRDFDFSKTFFENFAELLGVVPHPNVATSYLLDENSDYTNYAGGNKNCYLIFHADMNRDCMYGVGVKKCNDVLDVLHTHGSELLYECVDCRNSYSLRFCEDCENCSDSWFLKNCLGCRDCFGCMNLRQKEYYIFNEKKSREDYLNFAASFQSGKHSVVNDMSKRFRDFVKTQPQRAFQGYQNESVSGDQIFRCRDVYQSFDVQESRDMKFCHRVYNGPNSDCYDMNEYGMKIQHVYEGLAIGINAYNIVCGIFVNEQVSDVSYSIHVHHSSDIFGCIGAIRGQYCILNKQYSKDDYTALREKIISHMQETGEYGEFFPTELSPFGYNETVANEYFPMKREEVVGRGWKWKDAEEVRDRPAAFVIADDIVDVDDEILSKVLYCEKSGQKYKIQASELTFYRNMNLPIPRCCYHERHNERFQHRNPRRLFSRMCDICGMDIETSFSLERTETVCCEDCYNKVIL